MPGSWPMLKSEGSTRRVRARFDLGYAPHVRDWLTSRAAKEGISLDLLERAGLAVRSKESPGLTRERFRGRLMFPDL